MDIVVLDDGVDGVFDLDSRYVVVRFAISNDDVTRLADVERRIGDAARDAVLQSHPGAANRIDAVQSRVVDDQVAEHRSPRVLHHDSVCNVVTNLETLDVKITPGRNHGVR